jgi:hypothetical protein
MHVCYRTGVAFTRARMQSDTAAQAVLKQDKWWSIHDTTEAIASEIAASVASFGLNALAAIPDLEALKRIWEFR